MPRAPEAEARTDLCGAAAHAARAHAVRNARVEEFGGFPSSEESSPPKAEARLGSSPRIAGFLLRETLQPTAHTPSSADLGVTCPGPGRRRPTRHPPLFRHPATNLEGARRISVSVSMCLSVASASDCNGAVLAIMMVIVIVIGDGDGHGHGHGRVKNTSNDIISVLH